jgi:hypothetical protein
VVGMSLRRVWELDLPAAILVERLGNPLGSVDRPRTVVYQGQRKRGTRVHRQGFDYHSFVEMSLLSLGRP